MPSSLRPTAFTLTELIVAVGLVTLLMIGVTQIFKFAGDSVSTGQALSANLRDGRAAQDVFSRDITALAKDSPAIIIRSRVRAAFRNRADQLGDRDYAAATTDPERLAAKLTLDINGDGTEGDAGVLGERVTFFDVNSRMHRLDDFSFFARDLYRRQTANPGRFIADQASYEAWIHYGHLVLPHSNGQFYLNGATSGTKTNPGAGTELSNPQNFFANQWILGRVGVLLVEPEAGTSGVNGVIRDSAGNPQAHWYRSATASATTLSPLTQGGVATLNGSQVINAVDGNAFNNQNVRFDLAGTSIEGYRTIMTRALSTNPALTWWTTLMGATRYEVNPFFQRGGGVDLSYAASQQVPVFVQGASQFIVEFAGDFVTQQNDPNVTTSPVGTLLGAGPDGEVDYLFVNGRRQIRWYGFPRDTSSQAGPADGSIVRNDGDVVPLRDVLTDLPTPLGPAAFEKVLPTTNAPGGSVDYKTATGLTESVSYVCAWGPNDGNRPKMIRIVLTVEDPQGRLQEPPTFEYVFNLP